MTKPTESSSADELVRAEWRGIDTRQKVAFFAADISRPADITAAPVLTYTCCLDPDLTHGHTDEAMHLVHQKMHELAQALHALVPSK